MPDYEEWNWRLGPPPYIEQVMWPLYRAAVEAGDPGKLCATGFVLFDEFWRGSENQQAAVWTTLSSLKTAFAKMSKVQQEVSEPSPGTSKYWLHGGNMTPDSSAEHALGRKERTFDRLVQGSDNALQEADELEP